MFEEITQLTGKEKGPASIILAGVHGDEKCGVEALKKILPKRYWKDFNNIFVQFGQNICRPVGPKCNICPVKKYCRYYKEIYLPEKAI